MRAGIRIFNIFGRNMLIKRICVIGRNEGRKNNQRVVCPASKWNVSLIISGL